MSGLGIIERSPTPAWYTMTLQLTEWTEDKRVEVHSYIPVASINYTQKWCELQNSRATQAKYIFNSTPKPAFTKGDVAVGKSVTN